MKCKDCCCGNNAEIRKCPILDCPLYPFRIGNENKAKALMAGMEQQKWLEDYGQKETCDT